MPPKRCGGDFVEGMTHICCPHCTLSQHAPHTRGCPKECCELCDRITWCQSDNCPCHQPPVSNYLDSLTPEERKRQYEMQSVTTATTEPPVSGWEEQFNNKFIGQFHIATHDTRSYSGIGVQVDGEWKHIKDFIRTLLSQRDEHWVKVAEESKNVYDDGETLDFTEIERAVLKERMICYNTALSDLITRIKKG